MKFRKYANRTNSRRSKKKVVFTFDSALPRLRSIKHNKAGRNLHGHRTIRRGGRAIKNFYPTPIRVYKNIMPGQVIKLICHSRLSKVYALVKFITGYYGLIPAVQTLKPNNWVNQPTNYFSPGSFVPLQYIKPATLICNIELNSHAGAQLATAPGTKAKLLRPRTNNLARIRLPSTLIIYLPTSHYAQIGQNYNIYNKRQVKANAGFNRKIGKHPVVRGTAMNANNHPHGGNSGPSRSSVTPWGRPTK